MKTLTLIIFCWLAVGLLGGLSTAALTSPHRLTATSDNSACQQCHLDRMTGPGKTESPKAALLFRQNPVDMCTHCHTDNASSHSVNIKVDFTVPADLPLSDSGQMTCLTCHKAHGRLHSNRPWASVSFIDRILNSERLNKTYLLRRNNADGELCLVCHDPEVQHNHE